MRKLNLRIFFLILFLCPFPARYQKKRLVDTPSEWWVYDIGSFRLPADAEVVGDMGTPDASLRSASGVMGVRLPAEALLRG